MIRFNFFLISVLLLFIGSINILSQERENTQIDINTKGVANPWTHLNWQNNSDNFQFVVVTDRTGGARDDVFKQGVKRINSLQPEFVVSVGDF